MLWASARQQTEESWPIDEAAYPPGPYGFRRRHPPEPWNARGKTDDLKRLTQHSQRFG